MSGAWSLRKRVGLAFAALGFAFCVGFAALTWFVAEDQEHIVINALLEDAAEAYAAADGDAAAAADAAGGSIQVFPLARAPERFRGLSPGIHEPDEPSRVGLHVGVYDHRDERYVVLADVGEIEALERYLAWKMLLIVLVGTVLAGWAGWMLSSIAIRPVEHLAERVSELPVAPSETQFEREFPADALGSIARAIDGYQQRLVASDASEKAFFADASHELRTPLSVVHGALEVMCDDPSVVASQRPRLDRIERALGELGFMLDALLLGARRPPAERERLALTALVSASVSRVSVLDPSLATRITVVHRDPGDVDAPRRWADALFDVLLLRLAIRYPASRWVLEIAGNRCRLQERDAAAGQAIQSGSRTDLGVSLRFVERLCQSIGWTLIVESGESDGPGIVVIVRGALPD